MTLKRAIGLALILLAFCTLCALGTWQLKRLAWKEGLMATLEANHSKPALDLNNATLSLSPDDNADFTPAIARGHFEHESEIMLLARTHEGQVGRMLLTPFQLDDGRRIMVDRGFVAEEALSAALRPTGTLTLHGFLQREAAQGWMQPANDIANNKWYWFDRRAFEQQKGEIAYTLVYAPYLFKVTVAAADRAEAATSYPLGWTAEVKIANNHRQYAVTWFSLAAMLVLLTLVAFKRR